jgi:hypothetical protein
MNRIICLFLHHKYYRIRRLGVKSDLIGCKRCGKFYGINYDVRAILPFDKEMYEMYKLMGKTGLKKYINNDNFFSLILG